MMHSPVKRFLKCFPMRWTMLMVYAFGCAPIFSAYATTKFDLNGQWMFRTDPAREGLTRGWSKAVPADVETVDVPHTWNIGKHDDYEGVAWYFKTFTLPDGLLGRSKELRGKHVELNFGATFYRSRVWLNGVELGGYEGGYTAYHFDVTARLQLVNFIAVEVDNRPTSATIPGWALRLGKEKEAWYDWWHYGGIVRDVWLTASDPTFIRRQQIRVKVVSTSANVTTRVWLENFDNKQEAVRLVGRIVLLNVGGGSPRQTGSLPLAVLSEAVASVENKVILKPGVQEQTLALRIDNVKLWHFDQPNLYRLELELLDSKGNGLDSLSDTFGARTLDLRDRHLYLNGERVRLSGITRHEDSPWEGLAETRGTIKRDYDDLKALQVTFTRPVHYPQHGEVLDYCDRNGILLAPEIPIWQFTEQQLTDPKVMSLAKQMMREMIEQAYNHPSIMAWSVCNESETFKPGGVAYVRMMKEMIRELDPDRFVTFADDGLPRIQRAQESASSLADFIMWNQYFGTWAGPASLLPETLERVGKLFPDKMIVVSEFGAAGTFAPDLPAADDLRRQIMRDQIALFSKYDFIGGVVFWCYQDYKSHRNLRPGLRQGFVEMGLVDEDRQRRPSYFLWRELNAPATIALSWNPLTTYTPPAGFRATIARRGEAEIPSYELRGYRAVWEAWDDDDLRIGGGEQMLPDIGAASTVEAAWQVPTTKSVRLVVRLYRPTGFLATEQTLRWWQPRSGS
jgi:beta-glucuronidase